ncbi:MAG: M20/M25/M40 family metallo-hydrolase [Deltaproteobacteria bacterium]|nr:M20/M25/M40 family metallo-hydrolase [Deltaproteobacteria bacterium]
MKNPFSPDDRFTVLERRQRFSSRIALYGSLLVTLVTAFGLSVLAAKAISLARSATDGTQGWFDTDWQELPEVQLFQGYLRIDTNADDGSEAAGAEFLAEQLAAAGIPSVIERFAGNKANLWAILEGEDPQALVLHNHIDVEPVIHPDKWIHDPFSGKISPPWIYGRGAFDMKSVAAAQLYAFLQLKEKGVPLKRSVIFLATGSEERGSDLGTRWILRQHPELVDRFWAVLSEGGVVEAIDQGQVKYWGTEIGQKQFVDLVICSPSRSRIVGMRAELRTVGEVAKPQRRLPPEVATMFEAYAATRDRPELVELLSAPQLMVDTEEAFTRAPQYVRAMLRNEVRLSPVYKTEGGGYHRIIRLHLLPGEDPHEARKVLVPDWMLFGVDWVLNQRQSAAKGSSPEHPVFQGISQTLEEHYPGAATGPYFLPWTATDSRFFRRAGIPSFGFSPFLILTPDTLTGNHPNERVSLPGYVGGVKIYQDLLERLVL